MASFCALTRFLRLNWNKLKNNLTFLKFMIYAAFVSESCRNLEADTHPKFLHYEK